MHKEYKSTSIKGCKDWEVPHGLSFVRKIYCLIPREQAKQAWYLHSTVSLVSTLMNPGDR